MPSVASVAEMRHPSLIWGFGASHELLIFSSTKEMKSGCPVTGLLPPRAAEHKVPLCSGPPILSEKQRFLSCYFVAVSRSMYNWVYADI